jgi:hypothetical protein
MRDSTVITANDNWGDLSASTNSATAATVGAFALPENPLDSAILATLQRGSYTVQMSSANNTEDGRDLRGAPTSAGIENLIHLSSPGVAHGWAARLREWNPFAILLEG